MLNDIMMYGSLLLAVMYLVIMYNIKKRQVVLLDTSEIASVEELDEDIKAYMIELVREEFQDGMTQDQFNSQYNQQTLIQNALTGCVYGKDNEKAMTIELIRNYIKNNVSIETVRKLLGLDYDPDPFTKFEIMMYRYKKKYGKDALVMWIKEFNLDEPKVLKSSPSEHDKGYYIDVQDIVEVYDSLDIKLTDEEQIDVLAVLRYQPYKGMGVIDTIREMNINGLNCGTSGGILNLGKTYRETYEKANRSCWLFLDGKYIHLRFIDFKNEEELRRIVQIIIRYGNPGPLTSKRGYIVNTMYDKSRVLAVRPPASEYWGAFIRKFTLGDRLTPEYILKKEYTSNSELALVLCELLMRARITIVVTGMQGSGKTTFMIAETMYIPPAYTIRTFETAFELYLRELITDRNIFAFAETANLTIEELYSAGRKSDGNVMIIGELSNKWLTSNYITSAKLGSEQAIGSHHGKTTTTTVSAMRDDLVSSGLFTNQTQAERDVVSVLDIDIHFDKHKDGRRYIERITEVVPLAERIPYPDIDEKNIALSDLKIRKEYYERVTDRVTYITQDIIRYDLETNTYYAVNMPSEQFMKKMHDKLDNIQIERLDCLMNKYFGERTSDVEDYVTGRGNCTRSCIIERLDKEEVKNFANISEKENIDNSEEELLDLLVK